MKRLCLQKGISYIARGHSFANGIPVDVDDNTAGMLMATGRFVEVAVTEVKGEGTVEVPFPKEDTEMQLEFSDTQMLSVSETVLTELTAKGIDDMKMPELIALAEAKDIDISGCKNNEERKEVLKKKLFPANLSAE